MEEINAKEKNVGVVSKEREHAGLKVCVCVWGAGGRE